MVAVFVAVVADAVDFIIAATFVALLMLFLLFILLLFFSDVFSVGDFVIIISDVVAVVASVGDAVDTAVVDVVAVVAYFAIVADVVDGAVTLVAVVPNVVTILVSNSADILSDCYYYNCHHLSYCFHCHISYISTAIDLGWSQSSTVPPFVPVGVLGGYFNAAAAK